MQPSESCVPIREPAVAQELRSLVQQTRSGDVSALPRLRALLDRHPEIWATVGDLERGIVHSWVALLAGSDPLAAESIRRKAAELRKQLEGESPSPIERLLVGQVVTHWLEMAHAQAQAAEPGMMPAARGIFLLKRAESAMKRYLAAIKTLTTLRALVPAGFQPAQPPRLFEAEKIQA